MNTRRRVLKELQGSSTDSLASVGSPKTMNTRRRALKELQGSSTDSVASVESPKTDPKSLKANEKCEISLPAKKENLVKKPLRKIAKAKSDVRNTVSPSKESTAKQSKPKQAKTKPTSFRESAIRNQAKSKHCLSSNSHSSVASSESDFDSTNRSSESDLAGRKVKSPLKSKQKNTESEHKFKAPLSVIKATGQRTTRKNVAAEKVPKKNSKVPARDVEQSKQQNVCMRDVVMHNQSRLESSILSMSSLSIRSDESLPGNVTVHKSFSEDQLMIYEDYPSETYWREIAEQRRIAIEQTLLENGQLSDHLEVLQTENALTRAALESGERLLKMVGALD